MEGDERCYVVARENMEGTLYLINKISKAIGVAESDGKIGL